MNQVGLVFIARAKVEDFYLADVATLSTAITRTKRSSSLLSSKPIGTTPLYEKRFSYRFAARLLIGADFREILCLCRKHKISSADFSVASTLALRLVGWERDP